MLAMSPLNVFTQRTIIQKKTLWIYTRRGKKSKMIVLYMQLYIMHLFPFTSHLRGMAKAPHVKEEYQNAEEEGGGGGGGGVQQKKQF